jgi:hypothetical protein
MRIPLDIMEVTSLLDAITTQETALHLSMAKYRKLNNLDELSLVACAYADLSAAKRKLQSALASATKTGTSSGQ